MTRLLASPARLARTSLRSRRGLASALIILVLVLLVFFAVLSAVASAADLRLARKRAAWNQHYYKADSFAVALYADLDRYLAGQSDAFFNEASLAESLDGWLSLRDDIETFQITEQEGFLRLQILVLEPAAATGADSAAMNTQRQGITMTLLVKTESSMLSVRSRPAIVGWRQWQAPFDYEQGQGGIWKG